MAKTKVTSVDLQVPVRVTWRDSTQPNGMWIHLDELAEPDMLECTTVGYIVQDNADLIVMAMSTANMNGRPQVSGTMQIPRSAIRSITRLN